MGKKRLCVLTQEVLGVVVVLQGEHVCELVFLLHQVQPIRDDGMVLEAVFANSEHHLNHVLHALVDFRLVEDVSQALKYG